MSQGEEREREKLGLPPRIFFYTPEQIAGLLEMTEKEVKDKLLFYVGRQPGLCPKDKMRAVNIMPQGEVPQWRISEKIFVGWLRSKGIKFYEKGYIR